MDLLSFLMSVTVVAGITAYLRFRFSNYCRLGNKIPGINKCMSLELAWKFWAPQDELFTILKNILFYDERAKQDKDVTAVWLGPLLLVELKNPDDIEQVMTSPELLTKSIQYEFLYSWLGTGLLTSAGALWHSRRKLLTPTFHFKILEGFIDVFHSNGEILVSKLRNKVGTGVFDVSNFVTSYSLDIIAETAMSTKLNAQKVTSPFATAIKEITESIMSRVLTVIYYIDALYYISPLGKTEKKSLDIISQTIDDIISKKQKDKSTLKIDDDINELGEKKRSAFLDLLMVSESKGLIDRKGLEDEVNTFMFEGHDTTSSALNFALYYLSKNPDVQEKIYEELLPVLDSKEGNLDHKDLTNLKYLERVIKETLRLYPSVPLIGRKVTKDFTLKSGHVIPAGATIMVFIYHLHRTPEFFSDPDKFDPDRFLPEKCREMHPYSYIPFSAGFRNCIGQKFAMLELKSAIAKIVENFKILPHNYEMKEVSGLIIRSGNGINIELERR